MRRLLEYTHHQVNTSVGAVEVPSAKVRELCDKAIQAAKNDDGTAYVTRLSQPVPAVGSDAPGPRLAEFFAAVPRPPDIAGIRQTLTGWKLASWELQSV